MRVGEVGREGGGAVWVFGVEAEEGSYGCVCVSELDMECYSQCWRKSWDSIPCLRMYAGIVGEIGDVMMDR